MSGTFKFNSFKHSHKAAWSTELNACAKSKLQQTEAHCVQQPPGSPSASSAPAAAWSAALLLGVLQAVPFRKAVQTVDYYRKTPNRLPNF